MSMTDIENQQAEHATEVKLEPMDRHNAALLANVNPPDWINPTPTGRYNMVVIGGGTAGLVTALGSAGLGGKVALIERRLMGGDCLNFGCVPSKGVIASAHAAADMRRAGELGVSAVGGVAVDFPAVMERMRRLRAGISEHDSADRLAKLGVDIYIGDGQFTGPDTVDVDGVELRFARACIATGTSPAKPPIEGLAEVGYLTNETVFSLTELPRRLAVIGGGPIGCELGQAFARLGSEVTICQRRDHLLPREDAVAVAPLTESLARDGVRLVLGCSVDRVSRHEDDKRLHLTCNGQERLLDVDEILVAVGRSPNVHGMGLTRAGVDFDAHRGVLVNDKLQTSNRRIYAAGDVCMVHKFTHAADAAARIVIQNALFWGSKKLSALTVPWCTYTDPQIAHVGISAAEAEDRGIAIETITRDLADVDRAVLDGRTDGLARVHLAKGTDKILGATIVAANAGDMIGEFTLAMVAGVGLSKLAGVIHPYPTQAEVIKHLADAYNRTRLTPGRKKLLAKVLAWRR